jgi:NAD(P)-dependent dehydrogenase (short-subunit alcohol dehydrogenase family)
MTNDQENKPRVAIVTGGSRGIGRRCVERFASDGLSSVVVNYASSDAEANAAVAAVQARGAEAVAVAVAADVADEDAVAALFGRVLPGSTAYAATKGAVEAMTFILAHELRGRDINVNAVAPGPTATEQFLDGKDEEALARFAQAVAFERLGNADRHRRGRCLPHEPGRLLGQRPDDPRQRRHQPTPPAAARAHGRTAARRRSSSSRSAAFAVRAIASSYAACAWSSRPSRVSRSARVAW